MVTASIWNGNYLLSAKAAQQDSRPYAAPVTAFARGALFLYRTGHCRDVVLDEEGVEDDERQ